MSENKMGMKWHHFLRFVLLPLAIIFQLFILVNVIADICGIVLIPGMHFLTRILSYAGVSMNQLGGYLWPLIGCVAYIVFVLIMMLYAEIGLLAKRKYGRFCHHLYLLTNSVLFAFLTYCFYTNRYQVHDIVDGFLRNTDMNTDLMGRLTGLFCILFAMGYIAYTFMTIGYYRKRRYIFKNRVMQEETAVEEPAVIVEEQPVSEPETPVLQTRKLYCPNCGKLLGESDVRFCTNCGCRLDGEDQ